MGVHPTHRRLQRLRLHLARVVQAAPLTWSRSTPHAEILARFQADLPAIEEAMVSSVPRLTRGALTLLAAVALMLWFDWRISLAAFALLPIAAVLPRQLARLGSRAAKQRQDAEGAAGVVVLDMLQGLDVIRAFNLRRHFSSRYETRTDGIRDATVRAAGFGLLGAASANFGVVFVTVSVLSVGAVVVVWFGGTAGAVVGIGTLLALIGASVNRLGAAIPALSRAAGAHRRVESLIADAGVSPDGAVEQSIAPVPLGPGVDLHAVSYSHDGRRSQLHRVDLTLPRGSRTALVGSSGSGKSTLLQILMGEIQPHEGELRWGGKPMVPHEADAIRARIGFVPQRPTLFGLTLAENIGLGREGASQSEIEDAARRAGIHDTIVALEHGYRTVVGDGGVTLSGGQRQRVAVARAFVRHPDLLVLDEATSALDPVNAMRVLDAVLDADFDTTVLAVTHRLDIARRFDRIAVMHEGQLVGVGVHDALIESCAAYRALHRHQSGMTLSRDGRTGRVDPSRLAQIPALAGTPPDVLKRLASRIGVQRLTDGATLFQAGDASESMVLLARGQLDILARDGRLLDTLDTGDLVGEIGVLDQRPRTATVRARGDCALFVISAALIEELFSPGDPFLVALRELADARLRSDDVRHTASR